jgi:hypothetical protein
MNIELSQIVLNNGLTFLVIVTAIVIGVVGYYLVRLLMDLSVLSKNVNETSPMVYIRSNTDWVLVLDTSDFGDTVGNYYVTTTAGSEKVTTRLQERALINPNTEIILARGKAPADNEFVAVEFSVENPAEGALRAGEYTNRVRYVLREGDK